MKTNSKISGVVAGKAKVLVLVALAVAPAMAQVASHAPTTVAAAAGAAPSTGKPLAATVPLMQVSDKPVVKVNGTELTDRDLLREMLTIFPYARQHNGFPKGEEEKIRMGALKMIEFEELVYQDAVRRGIVIPAAKLQTAENDFRKQFPDDEAFHQFLKNEMHGSKQELRKNIRRSLLIEKMMQLEVRDKAKVTLAEARAYYDKNPDVFRYKDSFSIQTISIMPSEKATDAAKQDAKKRAEEAWKQAKATTSYQDFGLLAEKLSEDDFHVNMGDHHSVDADKLPPEIVKAARAMQAGQVSEVMQLGSFYTFFRLNEHKPAGMRAFAEVKGALIEGMERQKAERLRAGLDKKLRQHAVVQEL